MINFNVEYDYEPLFETLIRETIESVRIKFPQISINYIDGKIVYIGSIEDLEKVQKYIKELMYLGQGRLF